MVLLAIADADCRFILVDIGAYGSNSDSGVFQNCEMGRRFYDENDMLGFPDPQPIEDYEDKGDFPFVFVGDEAFRLSKHMMTPHPGRGIANFRLPPHEDTLPLC